MSRKNDINNKIKLTFIPRHGYNRTMKLEKYMEELEITQKKAAVGIGISRQYLCEILREKKIPGRATAFKIKIWSNGIVKLTDLWGD